MGYEKSATTWQMKHGINTEIHAKTKYKSLTKKSHKGMTYSDAGMTYLKITLFLPQHQISKLTVLVMAWVWLK